MGQYDFDTKVFESVGGSEREEEKMVTIHSYDDAHSICIAANRRRSRIP